MSNCSQFVQNFKNSFTNLIGIEEPNTGASAELSQSWPQVDLPTCPVIPTTACVLAQLGCVRGGYEQPDGDLISQADKDGNATEL